LADAAEIWTDIDLRNLGVIAPIDAKFLSGEIGPAVRQYRREAMMRSLQMHDLSSMPPLKPETIRRKSGAHTVGSYPKSAASGKVQNFKRFSSGKVKPGATGRQSLYPEKPLIDTGNLLDNLKWDAEDGNLEMYIGPTRADIGAYHQLGMGHNPQRVHLSWNPDLWLNRIAPLLEKYLDMKIDQQPREMHRIA
jgi:hypothetical protein